MADAMKFGKKTAPFNATGATWRGRALAVIRPGVEAALVAAVALGVAQAGWSAIAPSSAGASGAPQSDGDGATAANHGAVTRTPFAPTAANPEGAANAAMAVLNSVQLAGVRMSLTPVRSGAVLTMEDGAQHAFVVGQEISAGVRLAEVQANYVLLSFEGGQRRLELAAPERASFAMALMGQGDVPLGNAPAPELVSAPRPDAIAAQAQPAGDEVAGPLTPFSTTATTAAAPERARLALADAAPSPEQSAWLAATLAQTETRDGRAYGWRIATPPPEAAAALGIEAGDVVVAINGAGPDRALEALSAVAAGPVTVEIERAGDGARRTVTIEAPARS